MASVTSVESNPAQSQISRSGITNASQLRFVSFSRVAAVEQARPLHSTTLNELVTFVHSSEADKLKVAIVRPTYATGRRILDIFGMSNVAKLFDDVGEAMSFVGKR